MLSILAAFRSTKSILHGIVVAIELVKEEQFVKIFADRFLIQAFDGVHESKKKSVRFARAIVMPTFEWKRMF